MLRQRAMVVFVLFLMGLTSGTVAAAPPEPPDDAAILRALPRPVRLPVLTEVFRDDLAIVKEFGNGQWVCTLYYWETIRLPWLGLTVRHQVTKKLFLPPQ